MLIDDLMPVYDFAERHEVVIDAPVDRVYQAVRSLDASGSTVIRWLFRMRGLPLECLTLEGLLQNGFVLLSDVPEHELVLGLVGRFWKSSGDLLDGLDRDRFLAFDDVGYAKCVWNFSFARLSETVTRVATETRVRCTDSTSRKSFRRYWILIAPFSGWIRREMLHVIKRKVEQ